MNNSPIIQERLVDQILASARAEGIRSQSIALSLHTTQRKLGFAQIRLAFSKVLASVAHLVPQSLRASNIHFTTEPEPCE